MLVNQYLDAGRVDDTTKNTLKETYEQWKNDDYDFNTTKSLLIDYIQNKCKTVNDYNLPTDPKQYSLNVAGCEGLYLSKKNKAITCYLFNINNGDVFIVQYDSEHKFSICSDLSFEDTLLILASGYHVIKPEFLHELSHVKKIE